MQVKTVETVKYQLPAPVFLEKRGDYEKWARKIAEVGQILLPKWQFTTRQDIGGPSCGGPQDV